MGVRLFEMLVVFSLVELISCPPSYSKIINMTEANHLMNPAKQAQNGQLAFLILTLFEEQTCSGLLVQDTLSSAIRIQQLFIRPFVPAFDRLMVNNTDPETGYSLCLRDNNVFPKDMCAIPSSSKCDGFSSCLTDECGCHEDDTFKCADGKSCITMDQVCDSRPDCLDFSDECPCQDFLQCASLISFDEFKSDVKCFSPPNCTDAKNLVTSDEEVMRIRNFLFTEVYQELDSNNRVSTGTRITWMTSTKIKECAENDTTFSFHCKRLEPVDKINILYKCTENSSIEAYYHINKNMTTQERFVVFCDGIKNCKNGIDEQGCPQMFYCKSNQQPVPKELVCDSVPDCADSSDECNNCTMSSVFTSQTDLIGHNAMLYILMLEILGILCLNFYAFFYHASRQVESSSLKIDIIQCTTLTVYDTLMAVYLLIVCWKHWEYRGEYCSHDVSWRPSPLCKITGAISYAASHGALQVAVSTGICRSYQCRNALRGKRIKLSIFLLAFMTMNVFNLAMAIFPLTATFLKPSSWTNMFVHEFFFRSNPLIRRGTLSDLATLVSNYKRVDQNIANQFSASQLFEMLRNMTEKGEVFSPNRITSVGLYGASSLCYPDLFTNQPQILGYKVVYMVENSAYLTAIIICYGNIIMQFLRSRRAVGGIPANAQQDTQPNQQAKNNDKGFYLSIKVSILIGSQLVCWLPVYVAIVSSFLGMPPSNIIMDIFIINVAPINAIMNPILHTDLLNKAMPIVLQKVLEIKGTFSKLQCFTKILCSIKVTFENSEKDGTNDKNSESREKENIAFKPDQSEQQIQERAELTTTSGRPSNIGFLRVRFRSSLSKVSINSEKTDELDLSINNVENEAGEKELPTHVKTVDEVREIVADADIETHDP